MKVKKVCGFLMGIVISILLFPLFQSVSAQEAFDYGKSEISEAVPKEAEEKLDELGIDIDNSNSTIELTPESVFSSIWNTICEKAIAPLRMFAMFLAAILLCALLDAFKDNKASGVMETFEVVSVLVGAGIITMFFGEVMAEVNASITALATFMMTFVPSFAGVLAVNGMTATAAVYNTLIIAAIQVFSYISTSFIIPAGTSILGISLAGTVNKDLHIENIAAFAKKAVGWILGLLMTVFSGLLSVQSFISAAGDSAALRAAKFTFSSAVPIVGGSVADALSTVQGGMSLIKSSVGTFGIITVAALALPILITVFCFRLSLLASGAVAEIFGVKALNSLIKCAENILSIFTAVLVSFSMLAVISTALMLAINVS